MRLPRVRFTVRRLMVVVAVAAALMGAFVEYVRLCRKSTDFRARAEEHAALEQTLRWTIATSGADSPIDISPGPGMRSKRFTARAVTDWQAALRRKYERAAHYPWLPVVADSPQPN
jgi:hypothetical protein